MPKPQTPFAQWRPAAESSPACLGQLLRETSTWLAGHSWSARLLMVALSLSGCAYGVESRLADGWGAGAAGATAISGTGPGSGSRAGADANAAGVGGGAGATIADAQSDPSSSGGAGGSGGALEAGREASDATADVLADASVDAPREAGCSDPIQCVLKAALIHRYSFSGTGTMVTDSVGSAHGTVVNAQLSGTGNLVLGGGMQYVDLPNGIITQLTNATLEIWLTWTGGPQWQRILDFGNTTGAENTQGMAASSLYVTPGGDGPTVLFAAFKRANQAGTAETRALSPQTLTAGSMVQIAVVLDDASNQMSLYRNGALDGSVAWADSLSQLTDVNNWLGRSQYLGDPNLRGTLHEFRIYNAALSQAAIQASFMAGTDPLFLN